MGTVQNNIAEHGIRRCCEAMGVSRASYYRWSNRSDKAPSDQRRPPRQLTGEEAQEVLNVLNSERFMDQAVPEVYATLLDEQVYLCSMRSMYRILKKHQQVRERRSQTRHPVYVKPELLATGPNQVWSWDITKIKGPRAGLWYQLYVVLDIYSRKVVGWMLSTHESGGQARELLKSCCEREGISQHQLSVHSDNGPSMKSHELEDLLGMLQVARSFSRPHVSNDNPYSESQFKTLKYRYDFPERFGSLEDARAYLQEFFDWYNREHRHSGLAMMTPEAVHTGRHTEIWEKRKMTLESAYWRHPERFVKGVPKPGLVPKEVWINKPQKQAG